MRKRVRAGIIGDHHPTVQGYGVIAEALQHAAASLAVDVEPRWLPTPMLPPTVERELAGYDALWCGPWGPYENTDGALRAIRYARERGVPFLGTCAGFQHAAIEYARSVLGLADADHAESNPDAPLAVIAPLPHPWVERTGAVVLDPASHVASIYRRTEVAERYRCRFGLNPEYLTPLHSGGLRVAGVDAEGTATVLEFRDHPFYVATLFMPEQRSRPSAPHPLITAYLAAAAEM
ncbi:MAG: CTP synthase [uncultured Gemmatimonadaceae bacterium]|uniref:CTP synthase (glutamine hydrolyzing) n=1 Tax=uncultured Gemmatimonadaceae bacterium TaxID=246130 RepID=A0A6J4LHR6_9BACT|nr:MAG: CTP synthase [uncultured Gemmatimonadaceae bacterium]